MSLTVHEPHCEAPERDTSDAEWGYPMFDDGALSVRSACTFADCGRTTLYKWRGEGLIRMSNTPNGMNARVCKRSLREFLSAGERAPAA